MLLVTLLWRLLLLDLEEVGFDTTRLTLVGLDPPLEELAPGGYDSVLQRAPDNAFNLLRGGGTCGVTVSTCGW